MKSHTVQRLGQRPASPDRPRIPWDGGDGPWMTVRAVIGIRALARTPTRPSFALPPGGTGLGYAPHPRLWWLFNLAAETNAGVDELSTSPDGRIWLVTSQPIST